MKSQPFTNKKFKSIYAHVPRLTVEVIVKTNKGIILSLRKEKTWQNKWHIPGGTVYYKETLKQAVKRVALEELGQEVEIVKLVGYIEYPSEEKERGFGWSVGIAFLCKLISEKNLDNKLTKSIKVFKKIPLNIIKEQKLFLKKIFPKINEE